MEGAKLIDKWKRRLSPPARPAVATLQALAEKRGLSLYLVGGSIRDLILQRPTLDIDLAVEGDAPALAQEAAQALAARCVVHRAFSTASLRGSGFALDLAMTRAETYPRPGALPRVHPASIREDLFRRDFTIHALALGLAGENRGQLLDPFGGLADLEQGRIRVLHDGSFIDDATRILRAVRYEARLSFLIADHTLDLLRRDLGYLNTISGSRLRQELLRLLEGEAPERALLRCAQLGILRAIHPSLTFDNELALAFAMARNEANGDVSPELYLALLASRLSSQAAEAVAQRLALTRRQQQAVASMPSLRSLEDNLAAPAIKASQVTEMLASFPPPALWAYALTASGALVQERVRRYLREWRYVKPSLNGRALQRLGVPQGPAVGEVLRRLKAAKLDGEVRTRQEEELLVRSAIVQGAANRN